MSFRVIVLAVAAASAFATASAQAIPLPRGNSGEASPAAQLELAQFPVWGGFGDSPRGRPFVAGRSHGSSWWTPRNDYYTGRRSYYGQRYYWNYGPRYEGRYYSRRHLRRGWYR